MKRFGAVLSAVLLSTFALSAPASAADGAVYDPIPVEPVTSSLGLVLSEFASFPASTPTPAPTDQRLVRKARINTVMEVPDGSGRRAVPDLNGNLYFVENGVPSVYLDVAAAFSPAFFSGRGLGQGFGYVAFHPDFASNGLFYTIHTEDPTKTAAVPDYQQASVLYQGVIDEWKADDPSADTFSGTHRELLRIGFGGQIHGIQEINFNPTARPGSPDYGLLYLAVGDGGQGVGNTDPQNLALPHGKVLRIDPRGTNSPNGRYGIPAGNPFVARSGALGEIWAYGFRDPHRFSWDAADGRMFLGHIGEHAVEAIYEIVPGGNYGWSDREGRYVFDRTPDAPCDRLFPLPADDTGYLYPVAEYDHNPSEEWFTNGCTGDVGVAVAGGFVYRGNAIPALRGKYVFGDLVSGWVFYTEAAEMHNGRPDATIHRLHLFDAASGNAVRMQDLSAPGAPGDPNRVDLRFGTDRSGELYLLAKSNAKVWKVTGTRTFAAGRVGGTVVCDTADAASWAPVTPSKWQFTDGQIILAEAGEERPGPRRPFEYAVLTEGPAFSSVQIDADVRLDTPVDIVNRDVVIVFGWQSDTQFYYAHLSTDNTIYPHNGIFKVDNADRVRLDYQWNSRSRGANPAVVDQQWHHVQLRHLPATGEIAVYVNGDKNPLMTARDTTFTSGRVGFGSFDNIGRARNYRVTGTPAA